MYMISALLKIKGHYNCVGLLLKEREIDIITFSLTIIFHMVEWMWKKSVLCSVYPNVIGRIKGENALGVCTQENIGKKMN